MATVSCSGVNGYEDTDWQYTKSDADHNEYAGESAPIQLGCGGGAMQLSRLRRRTAAPRDHGRVLRHLPRQFPHAGNLNL